MPPPPETSPPTSPFKINLTSGPDSQINYNGNYQTKSYLKHSKTNDFFEYLYSYPPKFTIKWDSVDELTQDLLLENNYGVLEHSFPFIDFVEELVFRGNSQEATNHDYSLKEFIDGYLNKVFASNFYNKKTKTNFPPKFHSLNRIFWSVFFLRRDRPLLYRKFSSYFF